MIPKALDWSRRHGCRFDALKSNLVIFSHIKERTFPLTKVSVKLDDTEIHNSPTAPYLGITLDGQLRFKDHIAQSVTKGVKSVRAFVTDHIGPVGPDPISDGPTRDIRTTNRARSSRSTRSGPGAIGTYRNLPLGFRLGSPVRPSSARNPCFSLTLILWVLGYKEALYGHLESLRLFS